MILLCSLCLPGAQNPPAPKSAEPSSPPPAENNQAVPVLPKQEEPRKTGREKAQADAAQLSTLADQLRDQLNKLNVNVLPLAVLQKTETIEKLARKIRGEADAH